MADIKLPSLYAVEQGTSIAGNIVGKVIIPIVGIAIGYYILKTWKVIGTAGLDNDDLSWKALPNRELEYLSKLVDNI
jgi:hypothetical protein